MLPTSPFTRAAGFALCRAIVPLWVLTGAIFKTVAHTPKLLPKNLFDVLIRQAELPPHLLLATLIALEVLAVGVMVFMGRLARAMAIFMLSCFVAILIWEMASGNTKCGCLGTYSPDIRVMLAIDGGLLLLTILFGPGRPSADRPAPRWLVPAGLAFIALGGGAAYSLVLPHAKAPVRNDPGDTGGPGQEPGTASANRNPTPAPLPAVWYLADGDAWVGLPWKDAEIFQLMPTWPRDMDAPVKYVTFYGRTCDHCEDMFYEDLAVETELAGSTTAVEVPTSTKGFPTEADGAWPMPENECEHLRLPVGCDWVITTPMTIRIENGIIACVQEGDHKECMER